MRWRVLLIGASLALVLLLTPAIRTLLARSTPSTPASDLYQDPDGAETFSLALEWQRCPHSWCETGWYASPAVADLDEDGVPEVYWGGYTLMAVHGESGALLASVPNARARLWPSIVAADLEGDGATEIVVANGDGEVSVYGEGLVQRLGWPKQPFGDSSEIRSLAVADLDNDGVKEIVVCSTRGNNQWAVLEHNGMLRAGWPQMEDSDSAGYAAGCYNENVAVGDIDGDGKGEIVGPNDTHYVAAFEANGQPVRANPVFGTVSGRNKPWARVGLHVENAVDLRGHANCGVEHRPNMANSAPVIGDLNNDGLLEVVFVGNVYNCAANPYRSLYEMPFVLNGDRTRWKAGGLDWTTIPAPRSDAAPLSEDYNRIEMNVPNPVLADLDGDGFPEILHTSYDGKLHAWSLGKAEHGNWPYDLQPAGGGYLRFGTEPVVVDLDADGFAEVMLATWTENDSNAPGQLLILSHAGDLLTAVDLPRDADSGRGGALGAPTLANLDSDANLEVVIGTIDRGLIAYEIGNSAQANILWGTGRGGFERSGLATATWSDKRIDATLTVDKWIAAPGNTLNYSMAITNVGHIAASVAVTIPLPAHTMLDAATLHASTGMTNRTSDQITWNVSIGVGQRVTLVWQSAVEDGVPQPGAIDAVAIVTIDGKSEDELRATTLVAPMRTVLPSIAR